ncbi:hypothetical protein [Nocardioides halotolerans]|jgi:hypothetical protein|uniref:hypothetical protein n=1 Tax=Nocardioides halotolerans TaxID=433660 RepID=UPI0003F98DC6|nr:hypothetical protein [Nocardioides halotolerans]
MFPFSETEYKVQTVLFLLEALAYLWLAMWCFGLGRSQAWATIGGIGSLLVGVVLGVVAAATAEVTFLDSSHIYEKVLFHEHLGTVMTIARVLGVFLIVWAVMRSRRTPPAPDRSIYGSP